MTPDPLRHHRAHRRHLFGPSVMERLAEGVADGMGSTGFLTYSTILIAAWIAVNAVGVAVFDRYPYILLNLAFSATAFYTGALVIIAQKAQAKRQRAEEEASAKHREEIAAMHQQTLDTIRELVRDDTPGGVGKVTDLAAQTLLLTTMLHQQLIGAADPGGARCACR